MASLSNYGGKLSNFGNTGGAPAAATPDGIDELILAMGGWKTNGVSTITPSIVMSRPSDGVTSPEIWVSPCLVIFDASGTTKTDETNPIKNLFYYWEFGDDKGETWGFGPDWTRDKNKDYGHVASHVFETPGEYTITLTAIGADGEINTTTQAITVTDPDVVFAGDKTICYSNDTDFTGAPAGCTQVPNTTSFQAAWEAQLTLNTQNKRLLFKRGHTFLVDGLINGKESLDNIQIGPWGSGSLPFEIQFTEATTSTAVWTVSSSSNVTPARNFQFFDAKITNPSQVVSRRFATATMNTSNNTINGEGGLYTFLRIDCENVTPFNVSSYGSGIIECKGRNPQMGAFRSGHNSTFAGNSKFFAFRGNDFDNNSSAEHVLRVQGFDTIHVANNKLINPYSTKHCIAIRGRSFVSQPTTWAPNTTYANINVLVVPTAAPEDLKCFLRYSTTVGATSPYVSGATEPDWSTASNIGDFVDDGDIKWRLEYTRSVNTDNFGYVSRNGNIRYNEPGVPNPLAGNDITLIVQIGPSGQTANDYEPIEDVILEGNFVGENLSIGSTTHKAIEVHGKRITVRNNLILISSTGSDAPAFGVQSLSAIYNGTPASEDVQFEYNSIYSEHVNTKLVVPLSTGGWTNILLKENIIYVPNGGVNTNLIAAPNAEFIFEGGTSDATQMKTVNPYAATPTDSASFALSAGSYARATGVSVDGVFVDFLGTLRNRLSMDMGAISKDS
jgi:hypothetical protein